MRPFRMELSVTLNSDLHIAGAGRSLLLIDRCVELDWEGKPYIPAYVVRGSARALLERLQGSSQCRPPDPGRMCPLGTELCLACQIFGGPAQQSRVFFEPLRLQDEVPVVLDMRTGIGINRRLGTVEAGRLFFTETVPHERYATFVGSVSGWLEREQLGWLIASLKLITHLGTDKSRGLGRVQTIEIRSLELQTDTTWQAIDPNALLEEVPL
ncbi:MAG: RAMP superfamily CRISPR-associated protein [Fimbriimonadales bacterium]